MEDLAKNAGEVRSLFDLSGRVAVVTGGAKGLGEAMAMALAGAGADKLTSGTDDIADIQFIEQL